MTKGRKTLDLGGQPSKDADVYPLSALGEESEVKRGGYDCAGTHTY